MCGAYYFQLFLMTHQSRGSSLGAVPLDVLQKNEKGKQLSKSLTCCFGCIDIEEVEQPIDV